MIQCGEIYDCFEGNTVEVDILLDYMSAHRLTPRQIYTEVRRPFAFTQSRPANNRYFLVVRSLIIFRSSLASLPL